MEDPTCTVDDCEKRAHSRGWCQMHYARWWRRQPTHKVRSWRPCTIEGCGRRAKSRGWCGAHYAMWQRTGDPLGSTAMPDEDRFFAMVDVGDCWEWTGFKELGYGRVGRNSRGGWAHRHAYEMLVGPIPSGMQIDHLCRNRGCVNPDHMEVVTLVENVMRGEGPSAKNARKTHCKRGHPFDEENTKVRANGSRRCLACVRIYDQRKKLPPEVTVRDL